MEPHPVQISSLQTTPTAACYLFITSCCYEEIAGRRKRNHNKDFANVGVQSYHYSRRWGMNDVRFEVGYLPIDARTQSQWQRNSLIPWARETVKNTPQKKKNRSANSGQKQHHKYQMLDSMQHKFVQGLTTNLKWSSQYEWQTSDDNNSVFKMSYLQEPITLAP
jgi:hypothetical protein